jgi:hypothetical protein
VEASISGGALPFNTPSLKENSASIISPVSRLDLVTNQGDPLKLIRAAGATAKAKTGVTD